MRCVPVLVSVRTVKGGGLLGERLALRRVLEVLLVWVWTGKTQIPPPRNSPDTDRSSAKPQDFGFLGNIASIFIGQKNE